MQYLISEKGSHNIVVELSGRLQFDDHSIFKTMLFEELMTDTVQQVTFNLSQLEFIDSSGIGMLLLAHEKLAERGACMNIKNAQGQVARVLDLTQIETVFEK